MGIVTFTIEPEKQTSSSIEAFEDALANLGLLKSIESTEGQPMAFPAGTYGSYIESEDLMKDHTDYYRTLINLMKRNGIGGKYYLNLSDPATISCGEL